MHNYNPLADGTTTIQVGHGFLIGPDVTHPLPIPSSQLWGSGARGSVGFVMDAFVPTGNMINGPEQTNSSTWASQEVAEYVQIPETVPSFEHALYGWAEIGMDASGTTLYGFAYDDSGASIDTLAVARFMDVSAVPEPANALALASLLGGSLLLRSRRRAPAPVTDA
ncbi:MAG: PEP-CTERM sorting domain-containing protein [Verrucomicrobiota bacterium]